MKRLSYQNIVESSEFIGLSGFENELTFRKEITNEGEFLQYKNLSETFNISNFEFIDFTLVLEENYHFRLKANITSIHKIFDDDSVYFYIRFKVEDSEAKSIQKLIDDYNEMKALRKLLKKKNSLLSKFFNFIKKLGRK